MKVPDCLTAQTERDVQKNAIKCELYGMKCQFLESPCVMYCWNVEGITPIQYIIKLHLVAIYLEV